jgi:hypothetical protein
MGGAWGMGNTVCVVYEFYWKKLKEINVFGRKDISMTDE